MQIICDNLNDYRLYRDGIICRIYGDWLQISFTFKIISSIPFKFKVHYILMLYLNWVKLHWPNVVQDYTYKILFSICSILLCNYMCESMQWCPFQLCYILIKNVFMMLMKSMSTFSLNTILINVINVSNYLCMAS